MAGDSDIAIKLTSIESDLKFLRADVLDIKQSDKAADTRITEAHQRISVMESEIKDMKLHWSNFKNNDYSPFKDSTNKGISNIHKLIYMGIGGLMLLATGWVSINSGLITVQ